MFDDVSPFLFHLFNLHFSLLFFFLHRTGFLVGDPVWHDKNDESMNKTLTKIKPWNLSIHLIALIAFLIHLWNDRSVAFWIC